jgi:LemA protein
LFLGFSAGRRIARCSVFKVRVLFLPISEPRILAYFAEKVKGFSAKGLFSFLGTSSILWTPFFRANTYHMTPILWVIIGLIALIVIWLIAVYNGLIRSRNRVDEAWSDIEVQLKRRYDLIPNLVNTVKGYASQESNVLENVTRARTAAMNSTSMDDKLKNENMLSGALKSLFAVSEAYPDLKSNQNFLSLQRDLTDTEDKIQASRRFYNGNVRDFNTKLQVFPTNIVAGMLGFVARQFFDIDEKGPEGQPVSVQF